MGEFYLLSGTFDIELIFSVVASAQNKPVKDFISQ